MNESQPLPEIDVIIPVWNRPVDIATCLGAIGRQTYPRELMHVWVVDNGSSDGTADVVRTFTWATLLHEPVKGSYSARNTGIAAGIAPFVAFTDSDCIPQPDWLAAGVEALRANPDAGVIGGHVSLFQSEGGSDPVVARYEQLYALNMERMTGANGCMTANWFSPRHVLVENGGFDSRLKSTADSELSLRIAATRRVLFAPQAVVRHPARANRDELFRKERRMVGGRWQKHYGISPWVWRRRFTMELGGRVRRALRASLEWRDKLALQALNLQIYLVQLRELGRMARGGSPSRD